MKKNAPILVTDFDGTMARQDFYQLVRANFTFRENYWQEYLDGKLTHFEALKRYFRDIHCDEKTIEALLPKMEFDADAPDAIRQWESKEGRIVVVSAGCEWYIRKIFAAHHLSLELHANPGSFHPSTGLEMKLPPPSPYFCLDRGVNKEAVVQDMLKLSDRVSFAGDGIPDFAAAMLVEPSRRFARGWLAERLKKEGHTFQSFEKWSEIIPRLIQEL